MGYISQEEFKERLEITNQNNLMADISISYKPSNFVGEHRTPEQNALIGAMGRLGNSFRLSEELGIPREIISSYMNGMTSQRPGSINQEFKKSVDDKIALLKNKIEDRINLAVEHITEDKLCNAKATELAMIAANLSKTNGNLEKRVEERNNNINFVFFRPRTRAEDEYEVIDVTE